ncbi:phosphoribosylaminoimidazolesuccinocarboxamide synthase [Serinibacter arcticus]|uniref:phosphoribosylaminoimidazolesuccinocarboxamide synthase n=1 Tax=Serinibacter arcticus TaxID=1655435 RepID=UPI0018EEB3DD|nr:phosphoribosylaminoimidazolesuccinocarboxamide synthase [Serinibacter arcticus]
MTPAAALPAAPAVPGWRPVAAGKVRDLYVPDADNAAWGDDVVLVVASDRISAYDHVLSTPIPDKGAILTALSAWWFEQLGDGPDGVAHHLVSLDVPAEVAGRAMVCRRLEMYPVECVARGYLTGSGLVEYRADRTVCGVPLPDGLVDGSRLPEPIFTPAAKAAVGEHDENVTYERVAEMVGDDVADRLRTTTLAVYRRAEEIASARGIVLADTKFEFGADPALGADSIVLGDEVLTPDSSRFWDATLWAPGGAQPSFDKQYVRDWLTSDASGWDRAGDAPPPELPADVVLRTRERYVEAYERLTGRTFG